MIAPNLVLRYTIDGDSRVHIRGAVRIKVDGCGALTVYESEGGRTESVSLGGIRSLTIQTISDMPPYATTMIH